jgi:tRNA(Ile)-lysidine synthase
VAAPNGRQVELVRPLLSARRSDVLAHLARHGLAYAQDPTNSDRRFLRARVRHDLLPRLEEQSPRLVEHLCALADLLTADYPPTGTEAPPPDLAGLVVVRADPDGGTRVQADELLRQLGQLSGAQRRTIARWVRLRKGGSRLRVSDGKELELGFFSGTPVISLVK